MLLEAKAYEAKRLDKIAAALRPWSGTEVWRNVSTKNTYRQNHPLVEIAKKSQTNFLPLVLDTFAQGMKVDNYFSSTEAVTPDVWNQWQANQMDARQTGIIRAALRDGVAYASVLPGMTPSSGQSSVVIRGHSTRQLTVLIDDRADWGPTDGPVDDTWPIIALEQKGDMLRLYDEESVHFLGVKAQPRSVLGWTETTYNNTSNIEYIEARPHHVGVCPIVRFRDRWLLDEDDETLGIIEPLLSIQGRLDETTWQMGVAQYFTAFVQRYVIGWEAQSEVDALKATAKDIWAFADENVKVGQFPAASLDGYLSARQSAIQDLAAIAQVPPQNLGIDGISNISEATLAALETGKERKTSEIETALGESFEQVLRTAAWISGNEEDARDFGSEVKWRDATARSFAQTVDGLGKLAQMLNIPQEILWEDIPGWTREKVERAKTSSRTPDLLTGLMGTMMEPSASE